MDRKQKFTLWIAILAVFALLAPLPAEAAKGGVKGKPGGDDGGSDGGDSTSEFIPAIAMQAERWTKEITGWDIVLMNAEGSEIRPLLESNGTVHYYSPMFSPDGSMLAFASNLDGNGIYIVPVDGSAAPRKLISTDSLSAPTSWSADGRFIAFYQEVGTSGETDLFLFELDSSYQLVTHEPINLTNTPEVSEWSADWSCDGSMIVYNTSGTEDVLVQPFDASTRSLTGLPDAIFAGEDRFRSLNQALWNRTATLGDRLVFAAYPAGEGLSGGLDIWEFDLQTRSAKMILNWENSARLDGWGAADSKAVFLDIPNSHPSVAIFENVDDVILGVTTTPVVTETVAKVKKNGYQDFRRMDWIRGGPCVAPSE